MKQEDKDELRSLIQTEMATLRHDIEGLEQQTQPIAPDRSIGRLTRMEAIQSKSISEANLRKARTRLNQLDKALNRIDEASFGICVRCGNPIPIKRLMLVPESTACVRCPRRREED